MSSRVTSRLFFLLCAIDDLGYVQYVISVMPIVSCNVFEEPLVGLKYDPPNRPGASFDCTRYSIQAFGRTLAEGPGEQAHEYMEEWRADLVTRTVQVAASADDDRRLSNRRRD